MLSHLNYAFSYLETICIFNILQMLEEILPFRNNFCAHFYMMISEQIIYKTVKSQNMWAYCVIISLWRQQMKTGMITFGVSGLNLFEVFFIKRLASHKTSSFLEASFNNFSSITYGLKQYKTQLEAKYLILPTGQET